MATTRVDAALCALHAAKTITQRWTVREGRPVIVSAADVLALRAIMDAVGRIIVPSLDHDGDAWTFSDASELRALMPERDWGGAEQAFLGECELTDNQAVNLKAGLQAAFEVVRLA